MKNFHRDVRIVLIISLCVVTTGVWYVVLTSRNQTELKIAFLDIGQGDAIYIEAPNGAQVLIDAGPDSSVVSKLAEVMPFGDRSIDLLIVTNPDKDHIGGFTEVMRRYDVQQILEPGTRSDSETYSLLEQEIRKRSLKREIARKGMRILLDRQRNIYFDILFPDRDVSNWERNDGSIVGTLVYNDVSFMLMGDATKYTELLIHNAESKNTLASTVLKLGHHGSQTSSSVLWLETIRPRLAVISAGKKNRYGHPHQDITTRLDQMGIPYLGTYKNGTIVMTTDGESLSY